MAAQSFKLRYRPVRIGWCIQNNNFNDLKYALKLTNIFWGGRYNPIIPVDLDDVEKSVYWINLLKPDMLFPISDKKEIIDFVDRFDHIQWPTGSFLKNELFKPSIYKREEVPAFLDVTSAAKYIYYNHIKSGQDISFFYNVWNESDPLYFFFLCMYGLYPDNNLFESGILSVIRNHFNDFVDWNLSNNIPSNSLSYGMNPLKLSAYSLYNGKLRNLQPEGLFVGDCNDFEAVVCFWNLRTYGDELFFVDPNYLDKLQPLLDDFLTQQQKYHPKYMEKGMVSTWLYKQDNNYIKNTLQHKLSFLYPNKNAWQNISMIDPRMFFQEDMVVGNLINHSESTPFAQIHTPDKRFLIGSSEADQQMLIASLEVPKLATGHDKYTFRYPYIPNINTTLGALATGINQKAYLFRCEPNGFGLFSFCNQRIVNIFSSKHVELFQAIFDKIGFDSEVSSAGLVCRRIIDQMSGLNNCQVFKLKEIRKVLDDANISKAISTGKIKKAISASLRLNKNIMYHYQKADENDILDILIENDILRLCYTLKCSNCQLPFWEHIDNITTKIKCKYCDNIFNASVQIKNKRPEFQKNGLFVINNHQEGAFPVILTLKKLKEISQGVLHNNEYFFSTPLTIKNSSDLECEVDILVLSENINGYYELVLGECKNHMNIRKDEIEKYKRLYDLLNNEYGGTMKIYALFSKLAKFTEEEIIDIHEVFQKALDNLILLTDEELEADMIPFKEQCVIANLCDLPVYTKQKYSVRDIW